MTTGQQPQPSASSLAREAAGALTSDPSRAAALSRAALRAEPDHVDARLVLGSALRLQADLEAALAVLEPLAAERPGAWLVQAELGQALFGLGRSRAAAAAIEAAVALEPGWAWGWRRLGDLRRLVRDAPGALAADTQALRATAGTAALREAATALVEGRLDEAEQALMAQLRRDPHATPVAHLLAETYWRQGRLPDAERLFGACARNAPDLRALVSYADLLEQLGRAAPALEVLDAVLARDPRNLRCRILKSRLLFEQRDYEGASALTQALLADIPDQPVAWFDHGHQLEILGRFEAAAGAFRRCLELDPAFARAYWGLAGLKRYRFTAEDEAGMAALARRDDLRDDARGHLHFALGKLHEDAGRWAESFARYAEGNAILGAARPFDPAVNREVIDRLRAGLTPDVFAARRDWGWEAPDPIFVVGMPRSGSSLVEQILASHPDVEGSGELQELGLTALFLGEGDLRRYPDGLLGAPRDLLANLGRNYLEQTRPYRRLGRVRFVDKAPLNYLHVGLIQLVLPRAKIIDVRRHPMGCCLSAFKENFGEGWGFIYSLEALGQYYRDYVDLMDHYDAVLPGRVHRIFYEDLIDNMEAGVRDLLDDLELPFDPACLRFFENPRAVSTASAAQVRRPVYREAADHWRKFEPWLDPLKAALGSALDAYPAALFPETPRPGAG